MKKIAIIPARSGSKGLKDKNIIPLNGKPLLAYSIEAALQVDFFERVIVSTDSEDYASISKQYGAEVMMRGESLSNDKATTYDVIADFLERFGTQTDYFVLLQPTSPMRTSKHIKEAVELFESNMDKYDFLVSMTESHMAGVLVKPIEEDLSLKHFDTDFSTYRRQSYKDYSPNGAIFIAKQQAYLKNKHFFGSKAMAYIMNKKDSIDIDDRVDYKLAELLMTERENGNL